MAGMGFAVMGTATAKGERRAVQAAQAAIASPLLEAGAIDGARGILINITGSASLRLSEVNEASTIIQSAAHEDANIIFGAVLDEKMKEEVKITVIATGFRADHAGKREGQVTAAAAAISNARSVSAFTPTRPTPLPAPAAAPVGTQLRPAATPARETPSLQQVKSNVSGNFQQDDLDVPAFIRKRGEN